MIETEMTPREQLHIIVHESDRLKNIQVIMFERAISRRH